MRFKSFLKGLTLAGGWQNYSSALVCKHDRVCCSFIALHSHAVTDICARTCQRLLVLYFTHVQAGCELLLAHNGFVGSTARPVCWAPICAYASPAGVRQSSYCGSDADVSQGLPGFVGTCCVRFHPCMISPTARPLAT